MKKIDDTNLELFKLIINARNFHYENFNKWMTYYYVAVAAIFVSFYSIEEPKPILKTTLLIIGYITSVLWHLSCKGYYFWVNHWTNQLLEFEKSNGYEVYSVFNKNVKDNLSHPLMSANISTSKVTLLFSFMVSVTWSCLIFNGIVSCNDNCTKWMLVIIISVVLTMVLVFFLGTFLKSNLKDHKIV